MQLEHPHSAATREAAARRLPPPAVTLERAPDHSGAEALLRAAADAARCLVEHVDLEHGLALALETLRQHTGVSRVFINRYAPAEQATYFWMESRASGLIPFDHAFGPGPWPDDAFAEVAYPLREGRVYCSLAAERSGLNARHNAQLDSLSDMIVPITLNGAYRACIGFDSADAPRVWSDAEVAVLQGTAATIAAALGRHESEAGRLRAEHARALQAEADSRVLREREGLLQALTEATRSLLSGADFDAAVHEAMAVLGQALGVMRVGMAQDLPTPGGVEPGRWRVTYEWTAQGVVSQIGSAAETGIYPSADWWTRTRAGEAAIVEVAASDPDFARDHRSIGCYTILTVPLFVGGRWWGVVGFDQKQGYAWQAHEVAALQAAGACISAAMERRDAECQRLLQETQRTADALALNDTLRGALVELQRRDSLLDCLAAVTRSLLSAMDFDADMQEPLRHVGECLGIHRVVLFFEVGPADDKAHRVVCEWCGPGIASHVSLGLDVIANSQVPSFIGQVHQGRCFWTCIDDLADEIRPAFVSLGVRSTGCVPIMAGSDYAGAITFDDCVTDRCWSEAEIGMLTAFANAVGAAVMRRSLENAAAETARRNAEKLQRHSRLLAAAASSAEALLAAQDLPACFDSVLAHVGSVTAADRAVLVRTDWTFDDPGILGYQTVVTEWTKPGALRQMDSAARRFAMRRDDATWATLQAQLRLHGRGLTAIADLDEPFRSEQRALGVVWCLVYPITVEGEQWGLLGFDYATPMTHYDEADLAALKSVASAISAALTRERIQAARLDAERRRAEDNARLVHLLGQVVAGSRALIDADEFEPAMLQWLGVCAQTLDATRSTLYDLATHSPSGLPSVRMLSEWVRPGVAGSLAVSFAQPHVIDPRGAEAMMAAMTSGQLVACHTDETAEPMRQFLQQQGNASVIAVPIFMDGRQWGCLSFDFAVRCELQRGEVAILETAADTLSAVLKRNDAVAALLSERERAAQMRSAALARANLALRRSTAKLAGSRDLSTFLHHVLFEAVQLFPGALAQIFVYDPADDTLAPFMGVDAAGAVQPAPGPVAGSGMGHAFPARITGAWQKLLEAGGPVQFDLHADAHFMWPGAEEFHRSMGHRGSVCTVLLAGDEPVGVLGLAEPASAPFDSADFELIQTFAQQAALAIQTERYAVEAQQAAVARERASAAEARFNELARTNESLRTSLAALSRAEDETAFLGQSVLEIARHAGADGVFLFVKAPDEARLPLRLAVRDGGSVIEDSVRPEEPALFSAGLLVASPRSRRLVQEGGLVWFEIEQGAADDRMSPEVLAWHRRQGHGAAALQALMVGDRMVGMLAMTFVSVQPMRPSQSQFVHALCQPLALALELSRLSRKLQRSGEHEAVLIERQRLAREIHDGIAQSFLGIQMQLEAHGLPLPPPLEPVHALARHGLIEARRAVAALRPHALLHRSLPDAVARLLAQLTEGTTLRPVVVRPAAWRPLPLATEDHLFRIVQEALNNAVKHAAAQVLRVELSQAAGEVSILIADDGVGFDAAAIIDALRGGYGLEGMQQRARLIGACVEVLSKPREGTQVLVSLLLADAGMTDAHAHAHASA